MIQFLGAAAHLSRVVNSNPVGAKTEDRECMRGEATRRFARKSLIIRSL